MKTTLLILSLVLSQPRAAAQRVAIQNNKMNMAYTCLENPMTVVVPGCKAEDLIFTLNNGEIIPDKTKGAGHYFFKPLKPDRTQVTISKKGPAGKITEITKMDFRVRRMPYTYAVLNGKTNSSFSKKALCEQTELDTRTPDYALDAPFKIVGYTVTVVRDTVEVFHRNVVGNRIDCATLDFFYSIEELDEVVFKEIKVADCVDYVTIGGMSFIITDADEFYKKK